MGKHSEENSKEIKIYYLYNDTTFIREGSLTKEEAVILNYAYALNGTTKKLWDHIW
jgi:hypothetical protein